jgi:hypothetical protein
MLLLVGLLYYLLAGLCLVVLGTLSHVARAVFNVWPDRLTDKPWLDMALSSGYDADDRLFGTEYDEAGYYKLDSGRNLTIAVLTALATGWGIMLFSTEAALLFAHGVDLTFAWLGDLFLRRLGEARWY